MAPSDKDSSFPPSVQLLKMTLFNLLDLSINYSTKAKTISEKLIKDPAIRENHTPEVEEFKKKISEFQEKFSSCQNFENLINLVVLYSTVSSDYYEAEEQKTLSDNSKVILEVLKKYKSEEMDDEFANKFNSFVNKFSEKINETKEQLKEEQEKVANKILQWWEEAKDLQTYEEKMDAFAEYVKLYELE